MSKSSVEMSLDDIIKANKGKGQGKGNRRGNISSQGVTKRGKKPIKQTQNNRAQKGVRKAKATGKRGLNNASKAPSTIATKKLVQKLVKKALAQTNPRTSLVRGVAAPRNTLRSKFRGSRIVKKTVVLNRLKMNPRSRVIVRRPRTTVQEIVTTRGRGPLRFNQNVAVAVAPRRRINYTSNVVSRPVMVQSVPKQVFIQKRQQPIYQMVNAVNNRPTIRDHISRLRTSRPVNVVQVPQQVIYRQQRRPQQQRKQNFQQVRIVTQQRPRQQRNNNFGGRRQFKNEPFFDPPNFLQRVPVSQAGGQRRY